MNKKAFSLIELSIVILIIGIIIAGIIQSSGMVRKMRLNAARTLTKSSPVAGIEGLTYWIESTGTDSFATGTGGTYTNGESFDNNQAIGRWNDINPQSINRINVTQSTSSRQPTYVVDGINNLPALSFNNSQNQCLLSSSINGGLITTTKEVTLFVVQKYSGNLTTDATSVIWIGDGSGGNRVINLHSPEQGMIRFDSGNYTDNYRVSATAPSAFNSYPYIISAFRKEATSQLLLNGATAATVTTGGSSTIDLSSAFTLNIGCIYNGSYHFKGFVGEVITYNRALTTEERQSVEQYLSKKWGIKI
jgi:prepilin-type N-terminal cleavage/methylation domain-containing protein